MLNRSMYTSEQVHQMLDEMLQKLDRTAAPLPEPGHLENDIPQTTSPDNTRITLTVSEAAQMVGICKPKMYEIVHSGKVRSVKAGKKILISRQSLIDWLKKGDSYGKEAC